MKDHYYTIDTLRVVSSILVILSHYAYKFDFERLYFIYKYLAGFSGRIGVVIFFAISRYLASNSLKNKNIINYFKNKIVRIEIPYLFTYLLMSAVFILLALINNSFIFATPLSKALYLDGNSRFLFCLFPIDLNLLLYFDLIEYQFIGSWFISTVCLLYLVSPILNFGAVKYPCITGSILLLASIIFYLYTNNLLYDSYHSFIERAPEFYIGMLWYYYKDNLIRYKKYFIFFLLAGMLCNNMFNESTWLADKIIPLSPISMTLTLPMIFIVFFTFDKFQEISITRYINKYSQYSYIFMLLNNVIIENFCVRLEAYKFSMIGVVLIFGIIVFSTYTISKIIVEITKPLEEKLLNYKMSL